MLPHLIVAVRLGPNMPLKQGVPRLNFATNDNGRIYSYRNTNIIIEKRYLCALERRLSYVTEFIHTNKKIQLEKYSWLDKVPNDQK